MNTFRRMYPVLYSRDVAAASTFYTTWFGFEPTFESDWYVSLRQRSNPAYELAVIAAGHDTIPAAGRAEVSRLLINIEVDDATAEAQRLATAGVTIAQELRDEPFGQRHLIVAAPDGVLVDVIEEIPPSEEFAALFAAPADQGSVAEERS